MIRILCLLLVLVPGLLADEASKQAKIGELLQLTNSKSALDQMYVQMDAMSLRMSSMMSTADPSKPADPAIANAGADLQKKVMAMMREKLTWEKMQMIFAKIYDEAYTEEEIDGLLAFYKSPVGQSFLKKTPVVSAKSMDAMQEQFKDLIPAMQAMIKDSITKQSQPKP